MRVTITGGAGFIGHHLAAALASSGHDVTVLDNLHRGSFERPGLAGVRCIRGDVRSGDDCRAAFAGSAAVVHLAAQSNVMGSEADPDYTFATNVGGTWNVAAAAAGQGVRHLVFASSREIYGEPETLPVCEDAPRRPKNGYGVSKLAAEVVLRACSFPGLASSIVRLTNVIGPGDADRVVPLWLAAAREGRPLAVFGGQQQLDLVPVDVVTAAIARLLDRGPLARPVNIGSGTATALTRLAEHVIALTGSASRIDLRPARGPEVTRFRATTTRMRTVLGIEPPTDPLRFIEANW